MVVKPFVPPGFSFGVEENCDEIEDMDEWYREYERLCASVVSVSACIYPACIYLGDIYRDDIHVVAIYVEAIYRAYNHVVKPEIESR